MYVYTISNLWGKKKNIAPIEWMGAKKVVVIQDASKDVSWSAIRWVLHSLPLKPGDELILLGVLHQVNNPSTLSFMGAGIKCKDL